MEATFYCTTHRTRLVYTKDEESGHVHRAITVPPNKRPVRCSLKEGLSLEALRKIVEGQQIAESVMGQVKPYPIVRPVVTAGMVTFEREQIVEAGE